VGEVSSINSGFDTGYDSENPPVSVFELINNPQPYIPPGSVNEYQLRQVWLIPIADETQGVQVKLWYPLHAIPESPLEMFHV